MAGGGLRRLPCIEWGLQGKYDKISKADWADLYMDLYRQTFGETAMDETIMADAEARLETLKRYREHEKKESKR